MSDLLAPVVVCVNNDIPRPAVFNVVYFIYLRTIRCSCYQMDNLLLKSERLFTRRVCAVFRLLPDEKARKRAALATATSGAVT
jgi:hypothetical protein